MSDTPIQPGKYYHLGKLTFEHQPDGRWGVCDSMRGAGNCRTPAGALVRYWRAPHATVRVQSALTSLHLYRPAMRILHLFGQCFMVTKPGPDSLRRECTWCGTKARPLTTAEHIQHGLDYVRDRYGSGKGGE
jgi:hypothetical protein